MALAHHALIKLDREGGGTFIATGYWAEYVGKLIKIPSDWRGDVATPPGLSAPLPVSGPTDAANT